LNLLFLPGHDVLEEDLVELLLLVESTVKVLTTGVLRIVVFVTLEEVSQDPSVRVDVHRRVKVTRIPRALENATKISS
jgi:hypothetical protein